MPNLESIQTKGGSKTPTYDQLDARFQAFIDKLIANGFNQTDAYLESIARDGTSYDSARTQAVSTFAKPSIQLAIKERLAINQVTADEVLARMRDRALGSGKDFVVLKVVQEQEKEWVPAAQAIERLREDIEVEEEIADRLGLTGKDLKAVRYQVASYKRQIIRIEARLRRDPTYQVLMDGPVRDKVQPVIDLELMRERGKMHLIKSVRYYKDGSFKVELYDAHAADVELGKYLGLFGPKGTADDPLITEIRLVRGPNHEEKEEAIMLDAEAQVMDVEEEAMESVPSRNKPIGDENDD